MYNNLLLLDASVWGTVSDWTSIGVNFGVGLLIYKTLKSQVAVQKLQEKVTAMEHTGFVKSIEPKFELDLKLDSPKFDIEAGRFLTFNVQCFVNLTKNPAKDVKLNCVWPWVNEGDGMSTETELNQESEFLNYGDNFTMGLNVRVGHFFNIDSYVFVIKFLLNFSDMQGNEYSQTITARVSNEEVRKVISNPILKQK